MKLLDDFQLSPETGILSSEVGVLILVIFVLTASIIVFITLICTIYYLKKRNESVAEEYGTTNAREESFRYVDVSVIRSATANCAAIHSNPHYFPTFDPVRLGRMLSRQSRELVVEEIYFPTAVNLASKTTLPGEPFRSSTMRLTSRIQQGRQLQLPQGEPRAYLHMPSPNPCPFLPVSPRQLDFGVEMINELTQL